MLPPPLPQGLVICRMDATYTSAAWMPPTPVWSPHPPQGLVICRMDATNTSVVPPPPRV